MKDHDLLYITVSIDGSELPMLEAFIGDLSSYFDEDGTLDEDELNLQFTEWALGRMNDELLADRWTRFVSACLRWRMCRLANYRWTSLWGFNYPWKSLWAFCLRELEAESRMEVKREEILGMREEWEAKYQEEREAKYQELRELEEKYNS